MKKLITLLLLISLSASAQINPVKYYHFQNTLRDTLSSANLATSGSYSYVDGTVGKALSLSTASAALNGTTLPTSSGLSVQFAYKPNYNFDKKVGQSIIRIGSWEIGFGWNSESTQLQPTISIATSTTTQSARWNKQLTGVSMANYATWNDTSSWKVVAVTYDNTDGTCRIYLNGKTHASFSLYLGGDAVLGTVAINNVSTYQYNGLIDEVAFYNAPLDDRQVSLNYREFIAGTYYSAGFANSTKATVSAVVDSNHYGLGYTVGTLSPASYTKTCLEQLASYPLPRYYPSHTLNRNFNWAQPDYLAGKAQSGNTAAVINGSYNIQKELAYNWGYGILAFQNAWAVNGDDSSYFYRWITLANENPTIPTHGITNYAFTDIYLTRQSYGGTHYVKNSAGQFVNTNGVTSTDKYFDTYSPSSIIDTLARDGAYISNILRTKILNRLTATLDLVNDNDEAIGVFRDSNLLINGNLQAAKTTSGLSWKSFVAAGYTRAHQYYIDSIKACTGASVLMYGQDGYDEYRAKWSYTRSLQTAINSDKYSTPDLYVRWNNNWRWGYSAWHGINWINKARIQEIASGDHFYSPFVSAGWSTNVEEDVTPAQYLGILKVAAGMGAEFFFAGYFQEGQNANPKGYTWQVAYPSYVQAAISRAYSDFLNSTAVTGDVLQQGSFYSADSSLLFYAGDKRKSVTVRKVTGTNKWLIFSAVSGQNNMLGDVEDSTSCQIRLGSDTLKFYTRPQGSCYVWDKTNSIFYQLDGWHEKKHPMRWNKNQFIIENELADNSTTKTSTYTVTASTYDFRNFVTSITISGTDTAKYTFKPRNNVPYYVHIRCSGTSIKLITNTSTRTLACLGSMGWVSACSGVKIRLNVADTGTIQIVSLSGATTLDKMYFTTDSTESFSTAPTCAISGATNFCTTTDLTATSATSYLWTGGTTTQTKTISASGTYTVTITDNNGNVCSVSHTAVKNTVTPTISGITPICTGTSTTLTATGGSLSATYLWSTGGTNISITATAATYTVTVTEASCTGTATFVLANNPAISVSITGASTVCSGELTTIQASLGGSYLWNTGATTQTINAGAATYTVTVTQGACTGSATKAITTSASITPTITGTTTFCNTTSLSVGGYDAYLWSNGTTEQTATISSSGTYTVTVTQGSCTGTATVACTKLPTIALSLTGEDSVCDFTELEVATFDSYLWSSGETTASINAEAGVYTVTVTQGGCTSTVSHTLIQKEIPVPVITADTICGTAYSYLQTTVAYDSYYWSNGSTQAIDTVSIAGIYTVTVTDNGCTASASYNVVSCSICNVTGLRAANITENGATKIRLTWTCTKQPHRFQLEITRPDGTIRYRYVAGLYNQFTFNWCSNKIYRFRVRAYSNTGSGAWSTPVNNTKCGNFVGSDLCDPCQ